VHWVHTGDPVKEIVQAVHPVTWHDTHLFVESGAVPVGQVLVHVSSVTLFGPGSTLLTAYMFGL